MRAHIITIGDEILIGQIVDTNSAFIAKQLDKIGIEVREISSISDDKQHILKVEWLHMRHILKLNCLK